MTHKASIRFEGPAELLFLRPLNSFVRSLVEQLPAFENNPKWKGNIELVINEVFTNISRHAYPEENKGRLGVEVTLFGDRIEFLFEDWGIGFDPETVPEPDFDDPSPGGYGLFCIRQLMDEYCYEANKRGRNLLKLVKYYENISDEPSADAVSTAAPRASSS